MESLITNEPARGQRIGNDLAQIASRRPSLEWSAVSLACGIGIYFAMPFEPGLSIGWSLVLLLALIQVATWFQPSAKAALGLLSMTLIGFLLGQVHTTLVDATMLQSETGPVWLEGRIILIEERSERERRITFDQLSSDEIAADEMPEKIRLTVRTGGDEVSLGSKIGVLAMLLPPPEPVYPGDFDFARDSYFKGLGAVGYSLSPLQQRASPDEASAIDLWLGKLREGIGGRVARVLDGQSGAVATALLTGARGSINEETTTAMRSSGLAHLLAISGLHMALVTGMIFMAIRALLALSPRLALSYPIKKWAAAGAWIGALGYLLISGAPVSTQRAFLMVSIVLLAVLLERQAISMRLVAVAAIVILVIHPEALLSVSFQMSFAAVIGLVAGYKALAPYIYRIQGSRRGIGGGIIFYLSGILLSTLIAEISILPFATYHFHQFVSYGLLANLLAVPLMGLWIMPMGLMGLILMPLGLEAWALEGMGWGIEKLIDVAASVAAQPGANFAIVNMPFATLLLIVGAGLLLCTSPGPRRVIAASVFVLTGLMLHAVNPEPDIIIERGGRLVALRLGDGAFAFSTLSAGRYSRGRWSERFGLGAPLRFNDVNKYLGERVLECGGEGCVFHTGGLVIASPADSAALAEDCMRADIILTALFAPRGCQANYIIDGRKVRDGGAHAIWFEGGGVHVESVADARGMRPWTE
jgi:competence protein ComEC